MMSHRSLGDYENNGHTTLNFRRSGLGVSGCRGVGVSGLGVRKIRRSAQLSLYVGDRLRLTGR